MINHQPPVPNQYADRPKRQPACFRWIIFAIVLVALGLRLKAGYPAPGLWADELLWIGRIKQGFQAGIRAQGYLALHAAYFKWFGTSVEYQVRLFSIVSGLAFVPLFSLLVHRLFQRPWLTVIGTALVGVNVAAVSFTHEFKPYALDLLFHTAWLCSLLAIAERGRAVLVSTLVLLIGTSLSYSMVPLIAFQLAYMGYFVLKKRLSVRQIAAPCVLLLAYSLHFALLYPSLHGTSSALWASKYGVFFLPALHGSGPVSYLSWFFGKTSAYLSFPLNWFVDLPISGRTKGFPAGHGFLESPYLGALCIALLAVKFWRARLDDPRLIPVLLLCGYTLAGVLKLFPLGYFRSNLFILCYSTLALLFILQPLEKLPRRAFVLLLSLIFFPTAIFTARAPVAEKYFYSLPLGSILHEECRRTENSQVTIISDGKLADALSFYASGNRFPICKGKLKLAYFKSREQLVDLVSAKKYVHIFFSGSSRVGAVGIIATLSQFHDARLVTARGGVFHYLISSTPAL